MDVSPKYIGNESEVLLTEQGLASRWCVSVKTLRNARVKGDLVEFIRIGRLVRYRLSSVVSYEISRTIKSTSEWGGR